MIQFINRKRIQVKLIQRRHPRPREIAQWVRISNLNSILESLKVAEENLLLSPVLGCVHIHTCICTCTNTDSQIIYFILCVWVYVCVPHAHSACRGQKKLFVPLGQELQIVVDHHVGAGNETQCS